MNLNSREALTERVTRGPKAREVLVESHLVKGIAHQLRATRDRLQWSQQKLAETSGMTQNAISRLESPGYGKPTITTLKRLAAAMDVGLVVQFVPFSQMIDWISGTPRVDRGLRTSSLAVPSFSVEQATGVFDAPPTRILVIDTGRESGRLQASLDAASSSAGDSGLGADMSNRGATGCACEISRKLPAREHGISRQDSPRAGYISQRN